MRADRGTIKEYIYGEVFNDYPGCTMSLAIMEQEDRVFPGEVSFTAPNGTPVWGVTAPA